MLIAALLLSLEITTVSAEALCEGNAEPHLVITTEQGTITARLIEPAAPSAIHRLVRLAEGPTFHPEIFAGQEERAAAGYYDGLTFIHAQPHVEIVTGVRPPGELIEIETELDGVALGLDRQRIQTAGEAMDVAQREIAPAYKKVVRSGTMNARLKEWAERLYSTHDARFLIGVSQLEINEALGYVYEQGLESQPVTRGALMLMPLTPRTASARLGIALADMPQRTGRVMVIGHVIEGLDTVQAISVRPLADPGRVHDRHRPVDPVRIESVRLDCQQAH